jgi:transposase
MHGSVHNNRCRRPGITDVALALSDRFGAAYSNEGRPSIAPERLLRALLIQALYSVRSERLLIQQMDYNLLFPLVRWAFRG